MARAITHIIIHASATPDGRPYCVAEIDAWHRVRGFQRSPTFKARFNPSLAAIGYHYIIYTDGTVHTGRHPDEVGAHAAGYNAKSLGICLVGTDRFSITQWSALRNLVNDLLVEHGTKQTIVCGHRELPRVPKDCPGFDVAAWREAGMVADVAHILTA